MSKQIIFFQGGGGKKDHEADAHLVTSLRSNLGPGYDVHYPLLMNKKVPDLGRREQIAHEINQGKGSVVLVGHSLGASMLLVYLSENKLSENIEGVFLISTPFWKGNEDWVSGFKLNADFATNLDANMPLFLYHTRDDEEVPFSQFETYKREIPWATFREVPTGGHNLSNDLTVVANDIKLLRL